MATKIGRNEPCPCGSGKKYKRCHLGEDEEPFEPLFEDPVVTPLDGGMIDIMIRAFGSPMPEGADLDDCPICRALRGGPAPDHSGESVH